MGHRGIKKSMAKLVCYRQHYAIFQSAATKANPRLASAVTEGRNVVEDVRSVA